MAARRGSEYRYSIVGRNESSRATEQAGRGLERLAKQAFELSGTLDFTTNLAGKTARALKKLAEAAVVPIEAAIEQERVERQLAAVLESTAGAAGVTEQAAKDLASSYQRLTTFGDEVIIGAENMLLTFTNVSGNTGVFQRAIGATLDLATAMDQSLKESVLKVGKALNDPIRGVSELREVGITFSDAQIAMVASLTETNRLAEAQGVILDELNRQFGGSAAAAKDTFGGAVKSLTNAWGNLLEEIGQLVTESPAVRNALKGLAEVVAEMVTQIDSGEGSFGHLRESAEGFVDRSVPKILRGLAALVDALQGQGGLYAGTLNIARVFDSLSLSGQKVANTYLQIGLAVQGLSAWWDDDYTKVNQVLEAYDSMQAAVARNESAHQELVDAIERASEGSTSAGDALRQLAEDIESTGEAAMFVGDEFEKLAKSLLETSESAGRAVHGQAKADIESLRMLFEEGFAVSDSMGFTAYEFAIEELERMINAAEAVVHEFEPGTISPPAVEQGDPAAFQQMFAPLITMAEAVGSLWTDMHERRMEQERQYQALLARESEIMLWGMQSVFSNAAAGFESLSDGWRRFGSGLKAQMTDNLLEPIFGAESALKDLFNPIFGILRSVGQAVHDSLIKPMVDGIVGFFKQWIVGEAAAAEASTGIHAASAATTTGTTLTAVAAMMPALSAAATAALIATLGGAGSAAGLLPGLLAQAKAQGAAAVAFAEGGEVTGPTFALIGEDGREVVIPETKTARSRELLSDLYDRKPSLFAGVGRGGSTVQNVSITINSQPGQSGEEIAHEAIRLLDERLGRMV